MKDSNPSKFIILFIILILVVVSYYFVTISISRFSQPQKDVLIVGTNTPFPPFEYKQGNNIIGFDIELANRVGEKLNRRVVIKDFSDFAAIFPAIETGSIDMAISGITITPERSLVVDFSEPYYNTSQSLLTLKKNNLKLVSSNISADDFVGLRIGYQEFTTSQTWVENNLKTGILKENISFSDLNIAIQTLRLNGIDGIILDESVANVLVEDYPDLTISGIVKTDEKYGIIVKVGDPQKILPEVNKIIDEMKQNGDYDRLIKKYFSGD